jgi:hypothetical protein
VYTAEANAVVDAKPPRHYVQALYDEKNINNPPNSYLFGPYSMLGIV